MIPNKLNPKASRIRMFLFILFFLILIYVGYVFVFLVFRDKILFPGPQITSHFSGNVPASGKRIRLRTNQGNVEALIMLPFQFHKNIRYPSLMMAHGNAELIDDWINRVRSLQNSGIVIMLVEFPGYGNSEGKPTPESVTETFITAYDSLLSRDYIDPSKIVFFGFSIGGAIVCNAMLRRKPAAMVLINAFSSLERIAEEHWLPGFLFGKSMNNEAALKNFDGPVLFVHGRMDPMIPFHHSMILFRVSRRSTLVLLPGGHNDLITNLDRFFQQQVIPFLRNEQVW